MNKDCNVKNYCMRGDYIHRAEEMPLISKINDVVDFAQKEVYELALSICKENNYKKIVDYGCGNGYKINHYFHEYETIGYDHPELVRHCKSKYSNKEWRSIHEISSQEKPENVDVVICADVIEHAQNPEAVLNFIKSLNPKAFIISTPDRDSWDVNDKGPPSNLYHCREWNETEFKCYISHFFNVTFSTLVSQAGYNYLTVLCENE